MNDAQTDVNAQRESADHRPPDEIALVHLTKQREHQQPRGSYRNQHTWIAISQMSRRAADTQRYCAQEKQTQCPLQRQMKVNRSQMS